MQSTPEKNERYQRNASQQGYSASKPAEGQGQAKIKGYNYVPTAIYKYSTEKSRNKQAFVQEGGTVIAR